MTTPTPTPTPTDAAAGRGVTARFEGLDAGWPPVRCDACSTPLDGRAVLVVSSVERADRYTLDWRYCPACGPDRDVANPGTAVLDARLAVASDSEYGRPVLLVRSATLASGVEHRALDLLPDPGP